MSNHAARNAFRISAGLVQNYKDNCMSALSSLYNQYVFWPDEQERKKLSARIETEFGLPNCVGVADGTLFPLAFQPRQNDASDFKGRKHLYSITCLVVNDDRRRIQYLHLGWPGSTHDDHIWSNCWLKQREDNNFAHNQYIIGDSAFSCSNVMVASYKRVTGRELE